MKPCCQSPGLPKTFNLLTTDYIELRVCGDELTTNEDILFGLYDIYNIMSNEIEMVHVNYFQWNTFSDSIYSVELQIT